MPGGYGSALIGTPTRVGAEGVAASRGAWVVPNDDECVDHRSVQRDRRRDGARSRPAGHAGLRRRRARGGRAPTALAGRLARAFSASSSTSPRPSRSRAAFAEIERELGGAGLDGVVNNAGIGVPGPLEALPLDDLRRQLEVNVLGQVAVTQAALPLVRRGRRAASCSSARSAASSPRSSPAPTTRRSSRSRRSPTSGARSSTPRASP